MIIGLWGANCSGKSFFSKTICKYFPDEVVSLNPFCHPGSRYSQISFVLSNLRFLWNLYHPSSYRIVRRLLWIGLFCSRKRFPPPPPGMLLIADETIVKKIIELIPFENGCNAKSQFDIIQSILPILLSIESKYHSAFVFINSPPDKFLFSQRSYYPEVSPEEKEHRFVSQQTLFKELAHLAQERGFPVLSVNTLASTESLLHEWVRFRDYLLRRDVRFR